MSDKFKQNFGKTFSHLGQIGKEVSDNDLRSLFFGDYINPADVNKLYDEITDFDALKDVRGCILYDLSRKLKQLRGFFKLIQIIIIVYT